MQTENILFTNLLKHRRQTLPGISCEFHLFIIRKNIVNINEQVKEFGVTIYTSTFCRRLYFNNW